MDLDINLDDDIIGPDMPLAEFDEANRTYMSSSNTVEPKYKKAELSASVQTKDPVPVTDDVDEAPDLLDSILDDALNEFDEEEEREKMANKNNAVKSKQDANGPLDSFGGDLEKALEQMAAHLMEGGIDPEAEGGLSNNPNLDASIDQAVKMISEGAKNMSDDPQLAEMFGKMENMEGMEDFFQGIMSSLDGMDTDGKTGVDDIVEKMFSNMLQKEHFEQPMRDIAEKYPPWLEANKSKISAEEFENYEKQYDCFQRILESYKAEPVDTNLIMNLMKDMQEYGQPPEEIVTDMIPTLDGDPSNKDMEKCPTM